MNQNDQNKFVILGFLLGVIALFAFFTYTTKSLPTWIFITLIFAVQTFIVTPMVCKYYYQVNDSEIGFSRFIPFYQNVCIFNQIPAIMVVVIFVIMLVAAIGFLPLDIFIAILGEHNAMQLGTIAANTEIIMAVLYNVVTGVGLFSVFRDVNYIDLQFTGNSRHSKSEVINYFLIFIPCIRCIALSMLLNRLMKLAKLNDYRVGDDEEVDEYYESEDY